MQCLPISYVASALPPATVRAMSVYNQCLNLCLTVANVRFVDRQAEADAAEKLANETNPWNTVYGMVDASAAAKAGATAKYNECLLMLQKDGAPATTLP
jgi:hypothetical protein